MADITTIEPDRLRELARLLAAEEHTTGDLTPAGALTTAAEAVPGSLVKDAHGSVPLRLLEFQEAVARGLHDEVGNLENAATVIDEQERANAAAIAGAGGPR